MQSNTYIHINQFILMYVVCYINKGSIFLWWQLDKYSPFDVQSRIVKIVEIFGIIYLTLSVLALYVCTMYILHILYKMKINLYLNFLCSISIDTVFAFLIVFQYL